MINKARRSFLQAMAVAPVAAPAVINSTLHQMAGGVALGSLGGGGGGGGATPTLGYSVSTDKDWLSRELRDAFLTRKRVIEHGTRSKSSNRAGIAASEADALRSISPAARFAIASRRLGELELANELSYIDRRIADLKEQLGPLALLID